MRQVRELGARMHLLLALDSKSSTQKHENPTRTCRTNHENCRGFGRRRLFVLSRVVIADEIRRSTDRLCKALAEINETLNKVSFVAEQHR
jgi:hypothetical protein